MLLENNQLIIVDIGASGGIDTRWKNLTSSFKCILFEPDPREYSILKENSGSNLIVLNSALSDSSKKVEFHLCKKQEVSSIFPPNFDFLNKFPDPERFRVQKNIILNADTLNNQLEKIGINEVDFIKIDTQGYELPILQGSFDYLDSAIGMEIEVEFVELYKGQPLFDEVNGFVKSKGFSLVDLKRYYWKRKGTRNTTNKKGQLIFGDALYFKTPEKILANSNINQEKIIRSIFIYLAYGYIDLSQVLLHEAKNINLLTEEVFTSLLKTLKKYEKNELGKSFRLRKKISNLFHKLSIIINQDEDYRFGTDQKIGN
jgi:FkbM family methyltransferase